MFASRNFVKIAVRSFSTASPLHSKVTVLGAAGGIGQPLSLLLKANPRVCQLDLYDLVNTPGVAADISHINTPSVVRGFTDKDNGLKKSLEGSNIVVVPAGVPRKPGMTRDDLFNTNASIVCNLTKVCAEICPDAKILIISNPVNSTVPIASEVFKKAGVYNPKKIFGITSLDCVRASRFVADKLNGRIVDVPVVGGHAGTTIVPLFSQVEGLSLSASEREDLTKRVQFGGDEVVKAKAGKGSATLSMAFAGARFADSLMRAADGQNVLEWSYIHTDMFKDKGIEYFSNYIKLGPDGVKEVLPLPKNLNNYEKKLIEDAIPQLLKNQTKGRDFVLGKI